MSTRKLAGGRHLKGYTPQKEMAEKLFFRQQTEILSKMLQSDMRYCPSYKINFTSSHESLKTAHLSRPTSYNAYNDVILENTPRNVRPWTIHSTKNSRDTPRTNERNKTSSRNSSEETSVWRIPEMSRHEYLKPALPQNDNYKETSRKVLGTTDVNTGTITSIALANESKGSSPNSSFSSGSSLDIGHADDGESCADENGDNGNRQTNNRIDLLFSCERNPITTNSGKSVSHSDDDESAEDNSVSGRSRRQSNTSGGECQEIRFTNDGQTVMTFDSMDSCVTEVGYKKGPTAHSSSLSQATTKSRLFSQQHDPSIHCDILGPMACKFCTRHLSVANASLTLALQGAVTQTGHDVTCPLCRAEQVSAPRSSRAQTAATDHHVMTKLPYFYYTSHDIFLRVRNQKRREEDNNNSNSSNIGDDDINNNNNNNNNIHTTSTSINNPSKALVSLPRETTSSQQTGHYQVAEESTQEADKSDIMVSVKSENDNAVDNGMKVIVRYLRSNKEHSSMDV